MQFLYPSVLPYQWGESSSEKEAQGPHAPYISFSKEEWAKLRADTPLTLTEKDLQALRGQIEVVEIEEVESVYLSLTRLLKLHIDEARELQKKSAAFLGKPTAFSPFVLGVGGSVGVGKSVISRILQALLSRGPEKMRVSVVTTDGFLFPNEILEKRNLMQRKGFPESFDLKGLLSFLSCLKSGYPRLSVPLYSHAIYDTVPHKRVLVERPEVVIVEGLNVLQSGLGLKKHPRVFVSDYFDFSIYVDAEEDIIQKWYLERFFRLREKAMGRPELYFHRFTHQSEREVEEYAKWIWSSINAKNLRENILPSRERASLILKKGAFHKVESVYLRKL